MSATAATLAGLVALVVGVGLAWAGWATRDRGPRSTRVRRVTRLGPGREMPQPHDLGGPGLRAAVQQHRMARRHVHGAARGVGHIAIPWLLGLVAIGLVVATASLI